MVSSGVWDCSNAMQVVSVPIHCSASIRTVGTIDLRCFAGLLQTHLTTYIKCVLYMVCCSVPHHFLFLECMIILFLSPALEQHQYIYWSPSGIASRKKPSCCHSLVWSIVCDCGRRESTFSYSEWHVVVLYHHQAMEKGIVSCHSFECSQTASYLYVNSLDDNLALC